MRKLDTHGVQRVAKAAQTTFLVDLEFLCISVLVPDKRKFPSLRVLTSSSACGHRPGLIKDQPSTPHGFMLPERETGLALGQG